MTRDEIYAKVRDVLVDALAVDEDEVTPGATLTGDLGAESIDFLDIVFKLEQAFRFKIGQGELFPENVQQDPQFVQDGKVTPKGIAALKVRLPHADFSRLEKDPQVGEGRRRSSRSMWLVRFVERKLAPARHGQLRPPMRWLWIDRIVELVPRQRLVAIKNVTLAEEHLQDHFPAVAGEGVGVRGGDADDAGVADHRGDGARRRGYWSGTRRSSARR